MLSKLVVCIVIIKLQTYSTCSSDLHRKKVSAVSETTNGKKGCHSQQDLSSDIAEEEVNEIRLIQNKK